MLTLISYYRSGLTTEQINETFHLLLSQNFFKAASEYEQWVSDVPDLPLTLRKLQGVNLTDIQQRQLLYPVLARNTRVIDFWLTSVFVTESKQFREKLSASPWDLCRFLQHPVTGFSGTNDCQLLLPFTLVQNDLPQLRGTNGKVVAAMLLEENSRVYVLEPNMSGEAVVRKVLEAVKLESGRMPTVIVDVGALVIEMSNIEVVQLWLKRTSPFEIDAGVYFSEDDHLMTVDREGRTMRFNLSPHRKRMDRCVVFLDETHTRGTDLKLLPGTHAALTLGKGLTKDRLVQAAMRMRLLGNGHSIAFYASHEVGLEIALLSPDPVLTSGNVLRWAFENSLNSIFDGILHWFSVHVVFVCVCCVCVALCCMFCCVLCVCVWCVGLS